jgi:hypothetical protein
MGKLIWAAIAGLVAALVWLVWVDGQSGPGAYLFDQPDAATEAGYCLAVAERAREITHGQGDLRLEAFISENIDFWRGRVSGAAVDGRAALGADLAKPGVNEGALLHLAIQDCGTRAVALYGHRFESFDSG